MKRALFVLGLIAFAGCGGPGRSESPGGREFEPRQAWRGRWSKVARPLVLVLSTERNWAAARAKLFQDVTGAPRLERIDFARGIVLVVSDGDAANCTGIDATVWDDGSRILVRLQADYCQTIGSFDAVRPFGVFVLPGPGRRTLVVEEDRRGTIDSPPIWKVRACLELPTDPAWELDGLGD